MNNLESMRKPIRPPVATPATPIVEQRNNGKKFPPKIRAETLPSPNHTETPRQYREPDWVLWSHCHRNKTPVSIELTNGRVVSGLVVSYGQFTIEIQGHGDPPVVVFKHSIMIASPVISFATPPLGREPFNLSDSEMEAEG